MQLPDTPSHCHFAHRSLFALTLLFLCNSPSKPDGNPAAYLSGDISGFMLPEFKTGDVALDRGFTFGYGGSVGVRVVNRLYEAASATYLRRTGTTYIYTNIGHGGYIATTAVQQTFGELRLDLGPVIKLPLNPDFCVNVDAGITYLDLSLGKITVVDNGTGFWGAYTGIGLEHRESDLISAGIGVRYRYLEKQAGNFGGLQLQLGIRLLMGT